MVAEKVNADAEEPEPNATNTPETVDLQTAPSDPATRASFELWQIQRDAMRHCGSKMRRTFGSL